jgi:hypothetical protein
MNETKRLAGQLERALNGEAWHGPSWREVLEGVTREDALYRPIPEAHTIAEIVLHQTAWLDVIRRRLKGESPQVSDAEDWPAAEFAHARAWSAAVERLFENGRSLCEAIDRFPVERLEELRPGVDDTWFGLIIGMLQHTLYHAGQIGLLRKATVPVPR